GEAQPRTNRRLRHLDQPGRARSTNQQPRASNLEPRTSNSLGLPAPTRSSSPEGQTEALAPDAPRLLHPCKARSEGPEAFATRGQTHADPPCHLRSHRPAPDGGGDRRLSPRPDGASLGEGRGSSA